MPSGQFLASQGRHSEAAESYVTADALTPNDYEIVVGAANGLRQAGDNYMAELYYEKAVALRPQVIHMFVFLIFLSCTSNKLCCLHSTFYIFTCMCLSLVFFCLNPHQRSDCF